MHREPQHVAELRKLTALWSWLELGLPVQEDTQHLVTEAEMGRAWVCWPSSMTCYRQGLVLGRTAVKQHQIFLWFSLLLNMERRKAREGKKEKQETNWRCNSPSMETKQNKKPRVFSRNSQAHRKGLHREWPQVLPDRMPSQQFSSTQHIVFPCCVICSLILFFLFYKLLPRSHHLPLPLAPGNHSIFLEGGDFDIFTLHKNVKSWLLKRRK